MSAEDKAVVEANTDYTRIPIVVIATKTWNAEIHERYTAEFFRKNPSEPKATPVKWVGSRVDGVHIS